MILAYAAVLQLRIYPTNVEAQKIDGFTFSNHNIILANFQLEDQ